MNIPTTHAGSLPRSVELTGLHARKAAGEVVDEQSLAALARAETRALIARQDELGITLINNGEVGRESFFTYVRERLSGFGETSPRVPMKDLAKYPGYLAMMSRAHMADASVSLLAPPAAVGDVSWQGDAGIGAELAQFGELLAERQIDHARTFVSSPSPGIVAAAMENRHYPHLEDYVRAVARALANEYRAIVDAGHVLQIDAPDLAMERHTLFQDKPLPEFLAFVHLVIDEINAALAGVPAERIRLHVCWGNYEGPHDEDVPLADIWAELARMRTGGLLLSMANPRHAHEYRLFREVALPPGVMLIPGVIDTTTNYIEHPETVADRLERIAEVIGDPARIMAGTDCGFETSAGMMFTSPDITWQKLAALVEGARLAGERLF